MNRKWMQVAVAVAVALPATLAAQGTPRPRPAPRARARAPFSVYTFSGNRGRIGGNRRRRHEQAGRGECCSYCSLARNVS